MPATTKFFGGSRRGSGILPPSFPTISGSRRTPTAAEKTTLGSNCFTTCCSFLGDRNAIDRIAVFSEDGRISRKDVMDILDHASSLPRVDDIAAQILRLEVGDKLTFIRRTLIESALSRSCGSKAGAARLLGVHRKVIERALKERTGEDDAGGGGF